MKRWLPAAGWALAIVLLAGLYAGVNTLLYHIGAIGRPRPLSSNARKRCGPARV